MITNTGKSLIRSYLVGSVDSIAKTIAVGVGDIAASASDTSLEYEYVRVPVTIAAVRGTEIVFKATIPAGVAARISELGLMSFDSNPASGKFTGITLTEFSDADGWAALDGGASSFVQIADSEARVGSVAMSVTNYASGGTKTYACSPTIIDLSGYSLEDTIGLALVQQDAGVDSIIVTLTDSYGAVASYEYELPTYSSLDEYVTLSAPLSDFVSGDFMWSSVSQVSVTIVYNNISADSTVVLDSIKVFDADSFGPQYAMIGRIVLPTPELKEPGIPLDIEYAIDVTL